MTKTAEEPAPVAARKDWEWRRKLRANPATAGLYRFAVALTGLIVVVVGLLLIPLPGPGWVIVFGGLAIWASEFSWARRLLDFAKRKVNEWNTWVQARPLWVQGLIGLAVFAFVLAIFWVLFKVSGVPTVFPDSVENFLHDKADL